MASSVLNIAKAARQASTSLQSVTPTQKSEALFRIRECLANRREEILAANRLDKKLAEKLVQEGKLSSSLCKRIDLEKGDKFDSMLQGILDIEKLPDPTNQITLATRLHDGLDLYRVTCPVGVLLVIFEARPEVIVNISALAIKSGNAVILKGGKEALHSNTILQKCIEDALISLNGGVPAASVQIVSSRDEITTLLDADRYIDLVIPRGSNALVRYIQNNTRIPVLGHADGLCSIYVHQDADENKAVRVVTDAKINYPAACNAAETLLVHRNVVKSLLPSIAKSLISSGVRLKADEITLPVLQNLFPDAVDAATPQDFDTEFLDLIMAVRAVDSLEDAIDHINLHGSKHTDCILTENEAAAHQFMRSVDASGVYWNASTRFADGFRYGFGAEVGVSTNKTHARGPVGLEGLTIYKYRLYGNGHIVGEFNGGLKFLHDKIQPNEYQRDVNVKF
ncbi:uncharacterized protein VTP21DRAFT_4346 [Calcarisporiella thermophila]|uniref:uncharacterized protein n=1 Tax=Calcarisporiella thermophila TaxID=911321 RepID=UPI00374402A5